MNRRDLIVGAGLTVATALSTRALADKPGGAAPAGKPTGELTLAATTCTRIAQACLRHCLAMLATGNGAMGGCAKAVADLIPAVEALAAIAAGGSRHVGPLAKVVGEIARDCKIECDKHPSMAACKACADSCAALLVEIARV